MLPAHLNNVDPPIALDPVTRLTIRFGVMGSAADDHEPPNIVRCRNLGAEIARIRGCLLTGACPGLPQAAALGAKEAGGHTIGISPAESFIEHVEVFGSPYEEYDVLIFTGLGFMGRELINIRTSDIIVIVGGRSGTLGEFAIAYEEGKLIGVLEETGGIVPVLPQIQASLSKDTGAEVIFEEDPKHLIRNLLERYLSDSYICPCHPKSLLMGKNPDPQKGDCSCR